MLVGKLMMQHSLQLCPSREIRQNKACYAAGSLLGKDTDAALKQCSAQTGSGAHAVSGVQGAPAVARMAMKPVNSCNVSTLRTQLVTFISCVPATQKQHQLVNCSPRSTASMQWNCHVRL